MQSSSVQRGLIQRDTGTKKKAIYRAIRNSPCISELGCQTENGKEEQTATPEMIAKESHFALPVFVDGSISWPVPPCPGRLQDWLFLFVILTAGSQG